jgi:hypothetical protein
MKIDVPKITRPVDLGDYAEELRGKTLFVWVNPPVSLLSEYFSLQDAIKREVEQAEADENHVPDSKALESQAARIREILAELLSQGPLELRMSADEVSELLLQTADTDPQLYPWLVNAIFAKIGEHRMRQKKA